MLMSARVPLPKLVGQASPSALYCFSFFLCFGSMLAGSRENFEEEVESRRDARSTRLGKDSKGGPYTTGGTVAVLPVSRFIYTGQSPALLLRS